MRQLPQYRNRNVLVGSATADDAGVFRLDRDRALVQTTDFFTPIVDDPFAYGQIAAANALSDIFAMGGRPLTALNIMGMPTDLVSAKTIATILRGGLEKAREVGCAIIGGHTIRNPEPVYGLAVTGIVSPRQMLTNSKARPGDQLVLTKPLGTGIATTGIKRGLTSRALAKAVIALMSRVNTVGAELAERGLVRAATDITGFGLLGHLASHVPRKRSQRGDFCEQCSGNQRGNFRVDRSAIVFRAEQRKTSRPQRHIWSGRRRQPPGGCSSPMPRPAADCSSAFRRDDWTKCCAFSPTAKLQVRR